MAGTQQLKAFGQAQQNNTITHRFVRNGRLMAFSAEIFMSLNPKATVTDL
jgi:hypothetical protein